MVCYADSGLGLRSVGLVAELGLEKIYRDPCRGRKTTPRGMTSMSAAAVRGFCRWVRTLVGMKNFAGWLWPLVTSGVTGWCTPYGNSIEDRRQKLMCDFYSIKNRSVALDFMIFLRTIRIVLTEGREREKSCIVRAQNDVGHLTAC